MTAAQLAQLEALIDAGCITYDLPEADRAALAALLAERTALREALTHALTLLRPCDHNYRDECLLCRDRAALGETNDPLSR